MIIFFTFQGSFHFLKKEIPTRLANMIMELKLLPKDLMNQRECTEILSDYISSFKSVKKEVWHNYQLLPSREMVKYEGRPGKEQDLEQFSEAINIIRFHPGWETKKKRCEM